MALHNRITLILGGPVITFILSLYTLWTIELFTGLNTPAQFNFRDPKELGLIYDLLSPVVYLTLPISIPMAPAIILFVFYQRRVNKETVNLVLILITVIAYTIFSLLLFKQTYLLSSENPLTAFDWFLD